MSVVAREFSGTRILNDWVFGHLEPAVQNGF